MAIICALCNKHIAPMSDGGDRYLCAACIEAGHRLPEWDGDEHKPCAQVVDRFCVNPNCEQNWPCRPYLQAALAAERAARERAEAALRVYADRGNWARESTYGLVHWTGLEDDPWSHAATVLAAQAGRERDGWTP